MMFVLGSAVRGAQTKLGRGAGVSPASVVNQLDHMGVRAVPIIVLMSFLIGNHCPARCLSVALFRRGSLRGRSRRHLAAPRNRRAVDCHHDCGRSGSAITAEIGSMKMREEIDALKVIGLNPIGVLIFPRLVALTIALPLLTIVAISPRSMGRPWSPGAYSGITFEVFITRLHDAVDYSTLATGMIKAPFMA